MHGVTSLLKLSQLIISDLATYLHTIYTVSTQYPLIIYADLPTSRPHIYGLRSVYPVGALLNLSCESGPSSPPPVSTVLYCTVLHCTILYCTVQVLHWFLNGAQLQAGLVTAMEPVYPLEDKRGVARSLLKLPLTEETLPRYYPNIVSLVVLETKVIRMFPNISQSRRRPLLGPSPG